MSGFEDFDLWRLWEPREKPAKPEEPPRRIGSKVVELFPVGAKRALLIEREHLNAAPSKLDTAACRKRMRSTAETLAKFAPESAPQAIGELLARCEACDRCIGL